MRISNKTDDFESLLRSNDVLIANYMALKELDSALILSKKNIEIIQSTSEISPNIVIYNYYRNIRILLYLEQYKESNSVFERFKSLMMNKLAPYIDDPGYILTITHMNYSTGIKEGLLTIVENENIDPSYRLDAILSYLESRLESRYNENVSLSYEFINIDFENLFNFTVPVTRLRIELIINLLKYFDNISDNLETIEINQILIESAKTIAMQLNDNELTKIIQNEEESIKLSDLHPKLLEMINDELLLISYSIV